LGIDKSAAEPEIKCAFRKLVLRWHPDKNQNSQEAQQMFQQIYEAYSILHNQEKRKIYDIYGSAGLQFVGLHENSTELNSTNLLSNKNYYGTGRTAFDILIGIIDDEEDDSFFTNFNSMGIPENFQTSVRKLLNKFVGTDTDDVNLSQQYPNSEQKSMNASNYMNEYQNHKNYNQYKVHTQANSYQKYKIFPNEPQKKSGYGIFNNQKGTKPNRNNMGFENHIGNFNLDTTASEDSSSDEHNSMLYAFSCSPFRIINKKNKKEVKRSIWIFEYIKK